MSSRHRPILTVTRSFQPLIPTNPFELAIFVVKHCVEIERHPEAWRGAESSLTRL
jgi:hypothetical protein